MEDTSEFGSGRPTRYTSNYGQKDQRHGYNPNLVILCPEEEIICGDGCNKPALKFNKKH